MQTYVNGAFANPLGYVFLPANQSTPIFNSQYCYAWPNFSFNTYQYKDSVSNYNCSNMYNYIDYDRFSFQTNPIACSEYNFTNLEISYPSVINKSITSQELYSNNSVEQKTKINKKWYELTDTELRNIYGNYTRKIDVAFNGTAEDLNKYLSGKGVLDGKGKAFMEAQKEHGVNAIALVAIVMHESARGESNLAKNKKSYIYL
jgi:hypothetical protein